MSTPAPRTPDSRTPDSRTPDARAPMSAQRLLDLVSDTLDPGYAAAAKRRGGAAPRRRYERIAVTAGALVVGFLLALAYVHTHRGAPEAQKVHDRLVDRVHSAQDNADRLAKDLVGVQGRLAAAQDRALPGGAPGLDADRLDAGQDAAHGPGLVITLSDPKAAAPSAPPTRAGSVPIQRTHILTDRDVRSVVNQLWSSGAEAISVNDIRLTPTSAIRFAGEAVLVDFRPIASPYRISAIGDPDRLSTDFAQSAVAARYQTRSSAEGIGFRFADSDSVSVPAGAPADTTYATPLPAKHRGGR